MTDGKVQTNISEAEWDVMRIVWTLGQTHADQIIDQLQLRNNWSDSTTKTLMRRLVKKGLLGTKRDGRRFIYSATKGQTQMMLAASKAMLDHMCNMHKGKLLIGLIKSVPLSKSDIKKMQALLKKKERQAPDKVPCNCLLNEKKEC